MRRLAVLLAALLAACGSEAEGPRLDLDLPGGVLDFGLLRPNEVSRRTVAFRNGGRAPLRLEQVQVDCACARASVVGERSEYAPGESGALAVVLTAPAQAGPLEKRFSVRTNERPEPVRTWSVRAEVSLGLVLSTTTLDFGRRAPGEPATATVQLRSPRSATSWTVLEVVGSALGEEGAPVSYPFSLRELEDPSARLVELTVTHPGAPTPGLHADALDVRTSHPDQPSLPLPSRLEVTVP